MKIKIKYHTDIEPLKFFENGDYVDLRCAEDTVLFPGEFGLIPLGVSMQLPEGYEANIVPRSSTYKNFSIIQANHFGIVDESFAGDNDQWMFPAINLSRNKTWIKKNDRIAQFRIQKKQSKFEFEVVETLGNEDRGGIGSSGRR